VSALQPETVRVARAGLTALKGTRHQAHDSVDLSEHGPVGDRLFCLVDPLRRQVLKTVAHGPLLGATVSWDDEVLSVELGGQVICGRPERTRETLDVSYWGRLVRVEVVSGPWAAVFSRLLGRPVLLTRAGTGDIVYGGSVSVVSTGSLAGLRAAGRTAPHLPQPLDLQRDGARFRATFVVDTAGSRYDDPGGDQAWIGQELQLGPARIRLEAPIVRCAVVDLHPITGHRDLRLLDLLPRGADGEPVFGLQGSVVRPGRVDLGSDVRVESS
jgi:uncharacterized protein YcbX